jgi:DNA-binding CsgD family transcriptional regulator
LAERLATFAAANSHSVKIANFFRNQALETYGRLRWTVSDPGWTGMDRQALETRFARLRSLFVDLKLCDPDPDLDDCPDNARLRETPAGKTSVGSVGGNGHPADHLTNREREVLKCIAEGNSTKQAAEMLGVTFKTAACHRYRLMDKLAIHDTASLVRYAIRAGLVQP